MRYWRTRDVSGGQILELPFDDDSDDDVEDEPCSSLTPKIVIRDYQEAATDACIKAFKDGLTRIAVSLPTGAGKTVAFVHLIERLPARRKRDQTLILVHNIELLKQVAETVRRMRGPRCCIGLEQGPQEATGDEEIIIATWQSLKNPSRLKKFKPRKFKLVIVDEAHHASAESYLKILHHFNAGVNYEEIIGLYGPEVLPEESERRRGFSATLVRDDGRPLRWVFEKIAYQLSVRQLLEREFLCEVEFITVFNRFEALYEAWTPEVGRLGEDGIYRTTKVDAIKEEDDGSDHIGLEDLFDHDYGYGEDDDDENEQKQENKEKKTLGKFARTEAFNNLVVKTYETEAKDRKSTIVFCASLACVNVVVAAFTKADYQTHAISSLTPERDRKRIMADFKAGQFPILIKCLVLTEGADMPAVDCILLARPTKSRVYFSQMTGRGMRLSPGTGKQGCLIVAFSERSAGSVSRSNPA